MGDKNMNVYKFLLLVLALAVTPDPSAAEVQNVTYCDPHRRSALTV